MINLKRFVPAAVRVAVFVGVCCISAGLQAQASRCNNVVDNSDPGFSASSNWGTSSSGYGGTSRYRMTAAVSDHATWVSPVNLTGNYKISVWYSAGANRSPSASYILPNGSTVVINQQLNGSQWVTLGTVALSNSNAPVKLSCYGPTGYIVIADAVRYCPL